ncbi:MAG: PadR family transcriptional regulator [Gammaproteobacteria bacterium]|jgi:transcriptional regulator
MAKNENLHGTLELLVLKILRGGPRHGFAIATAIQQASDDVLRVEAGSLYPALHRMTDEGLLESKWQKSEAGRRARFYRLTPRGRRKLESAEAKWHAVSAAVAKVLKAT